MTTNDEQVCIAREWRRARTVIARALANLPDDPEVIAATISSRELRTTVVLLRRALAFAERAPGVGG